MAAAGSLHVAIALAGLTLVLRRRRLASALAVAGIVMGCARWSLAGCEHRAPPAGGIQTAMVAVANVFTLNPSRALAIEAATGSRPDLVCLLETRPEDQAEFKDIPWLPHQVWDHSNVGIALLSSLPLENVEVHREVQPPFIEAMVRLADRPVTVIACHAPSPRDDHAERSQRGYLATIAATLSRLDGPALLLGDLNLPVGTIQWSEFRDRAQLLRPMGHEPSTWPAAMGAFGIAIDHILGRGLGIDRPRAIVLPGSDHRGLATRISLPNSDPR